MQTTTENPTLESLGLKCTIISNGIQAMNEGEVPVLKWNCLFTNTKTGKTESFDYFTGTGCVPWNDYRVRGEYIHPMWFLNVRDTKDRWLMKDKDLLARAALYVAQKAHWTPDAIEILNCIARDGDALEFTFEDWANDFGYDDDSRKAKKIYRARQDNALRLRKILSKEKIEELKALDI